MLTIIILEIVFVGQYSRLDEGVLTRYRKNFYNVYVNVKINSMSTRKKVLIISLAVLLAAGAAGVWYVKYRHTAETAKTTSTSKTAQKDYSDGGDRESNSGGIQKGGAVDTGGTGVPNTTSGISSASGLITVGKPLKDALLENGSVIGGTAKDLKQVQYRLIDNQVGVIAEGSLRVVNGAFSGTLQFDPHSASGRLDIFTYTNLSEEENNIEIPVNFKE